MILHSLVCTLLPETATALALGVNVVYLDTSDNLLRFASSNDLSTSGTIKYIVFGSAAPNSQVMAYKTGYSSVLPGFTNGLYYLGLNGGITINHLLGGGYICFVGQVSQGQLNVDFGLDRII